jgi:hypothetical protein
MFIFTLLSILDLFLDHGASVVAYDTNITCSTLYFVASRSHTLVGKVDNIELMWQGLDAMVDGINLGVMDHGVVL